jgi:hypothetical protein
MPPAQANKRVLLPKPGSVQVTVEPSVTEREIVEERENIVLGLHSAYLTLVDDMAEFQEEWDKNPALAFIISAQEGFNHGSAAWLSDQAELFEKETWVNLGEKVMEMAGSARDTMEGHAVKQFNALEAKLEKSAKDSGSTVTTWAWWQTAIKGEANEFVRDETAKFNAIKAQAEDLAHTVLNTAETARKIYKHREAILNLPALIAKGEPKPIQSFVEIELMDIDKELATWIRYHPNFALVLEIIHDNDSVLTYLAYVGLMFEAVPPNFYAYVAGKGGAYLMIEIILLVVSALLSAGTAAAGRIAMLVARFAVTGAKVAIGSARVQRARVATATFLRTLEALSRATDDLHTFGAKLVKARAKPLAITGKSETKIVARKESIKRDKKCRVCGATDHVTPKNYTLGTVEYK